MPHLTMGNLSSCLNWLAGKLKMPQRTERICQVISLIGRKYPRCPTWPWEICPVVSTDWQELSKITQLTEGNLASYPSWFGRKYPRCPLSMGNLANYRNWLAGNISKMSQLTKGICQVIPTDWKEISEMPQRTERISQVIPLISRN